MYLRAALPESAQLLSISMLKANPAPALATACLLHTVKVRFECNNVSPKPHRCQRGTSKNACWRASQWELFTEMCISAAAQDCPWGGSGQHCSGNPVQKDKNTTTSGGCSSNPLVRTLRLYKCSTRTSSLRIMDALISCETFRDSIDNRKELWSLVLKSG